ncbi:hypothetical protein [Duganella vulcania]|uniref:Uncharacterized protein n=1 Tax=Duganella vulcania TaxID=2692166 RepID=A0A845GJG9_9BURK|nr:hypothetical protein [Duganella vulcania]MYM93640.1 hypothetical protein [Duganella vulcania]
MRLRTYLAALMLTLPLCGAHAADWTVRFDGAGPLKIGMRFDAVNKVLGDHMERTPKELRGSPNCFQLEPARQPGLLLMFVGDVLKRVDVMEEGISTERGIGLGDPVEKIRQVYGEAVTSAPQAYDDSEQTLTVKAGGGQYAIRFDTSKGKVGAIYAGAWKEVQYIEGCL